MSQRTLSLRLEYNSDSQRDMFLDSSPASLFIGGVGSGKTWVGARRAIKMVLEYPQSLGLIASGSSVQLNQSTLPEFYKALAEWGFERGVDYVVNREPPPEWGIKSRFTRHNRVISFKNGAQIATRALWKHSWESVLGLTIGWAWLDESRNMEIDSFKAVLGRLRCQKIPQPQIFLTSTPNGYDWQYDYFYKDPLNYPEKNLAKKRTYFRGATQDNEHNLGAGYIDSLKESLDPELAKQELLGLWVPLHTGLCYHAFDQEIHVKTTEYDPYDEVWLCCDFNVAPMSWVVCQVSRSNVGPARRRLDLVRVIDEIVINTSSTHEAVNEFKERGYAKHPDQVFVFGDSSGHHGTTISDYAVIKNAGFSNIYVNQSNPAVPNRIAAVNAKLRNANSDVGLIIDPKCHQLILDLSSVRFKEGTRQIDKSDPKRTHTSDALGYAIYANYPVGGQVEMRNVSNL